MQRRDWNILSSGNNLFTADERFQINHLPNSQEWTLIIKYLQKKDEGLYVCQVRWVASKGLANEFEFVDESEKSDFTMVLYLLSKEALSFCTKYLLLD